MEKAVICASKALLGEADAWKAKLEGMGYDVIRCPAPADSPEAYKKAHAEHYRKIADADLLFVLNGDLRGATNYIGPSVFAEIAFATGLNLTYGKNIKIYALNPLPENLPHSEELKLWEKLGWIKIWGKGV